MQFLVISAQVYSLSQALDFGRGLVLQLVGKRNACITDKVVQPPCAEEFVNDLHAAQHLRRSHGFADTLIYDILTIDHQFIKLHTDHNLGTEGIPLHTTCSREAAVAASLYFVNSKIILANGHHLALELGGILGGRCLVIDFDLCLALEILLAKALGESKVHHVVISREANGMSFLDNGKDAQQHVVASLHIVLYIIPRDGVLQFFCLDSVEGFLFQDLFHFGVFLIVEELQFIFYLDGIALMAFAAHEVRSIP